MISPAFNSAYVYIDKLSTLQTAGTSSRTSTSASTNIFDDLPALQGPEATTLLDELAIYLSTGRDLKVKDGLRWWFEHKHLYSNLSCMAIDYNLFIYSRYVINFLIFSFTIANAHCSNIG